MSWSLNINETNLLKLIIIICIQILVGIFWFIKACLITTILQTETRKLILNFKLKHKINVDLCTIQTWVLILINTKASMLIFMSYQTMGVDYQHESYHEFSYLYNTQAWMLIYHNAKNTVIPKPKCWYLYSTNAWRLICIFTTKHECWLSAWVN